MVVIKFTRNTAQMITLNKDLEINEQVKKITEVPKKYASQKESF